MLEVKRSFGKKGGFTLTWRVGFEWNKDHTALTLGKDPKSRPAEASLKGFRTETDDGDIVVKSATRRLPVTVECKTLPDGHILLDGKEYEPLSD